MKPLTKDNIIRFLKTSPSPDVIGFICENSGKNQGVLYKKDPKFKENVVDLLALESLTKTIVDIRYRFVYSRCEFEVCLSDSFLETNIDWDIIDAFLENIKRLD